jgi:hypothetical protein
VDPQAPEHSEPELDALLRSRRPMPDEAWVAATERRLLPTRRRISWGRTPALRLGTALAIALAGLVLALSLAGGGPLAGNDSVEAKDECRTVTVTRTERVPTIVEDASGEPQVRYRTERVRRTERRCN